MIGAVSSSATELLTRIAEGSSDATDIENLRLASIASGRDARLQFGKYIVNLERGKDIHIGDKVFLGDSAETIRRAVEAVQSDLAQNSFQVSLRDYFQALRMYAEEFPYPGVNAALGTTLNNVYVPLDVIRQTDGANMGTEMETTCDIRTALERSTSENRGSLLLIGAPGAGKSTVLHQILNHAWDRPEEIGLKDSHLAILVRFQYLMRSVGASVEERLWGACRESNDYVLSSPPPVGWFTQWPKITGKSWLLLLDGLDEVPTSREVEIETWLRKVQELGHTSIVTSRTVVALSSSQFLRNRFTWYRIQPLTVSQQRDLVNNWLGKESDRFLEEVKRLRTGQLSDTPLLLTIAAAVFKSDKRLPARRSALYRRFVAMWLAEAIRRGLAEDLGETAQYIEKVLANIAFSMSVRPQCAHEEILKTELEQFFSSKLGRTPLEAGALAQRFLEASGRKIGLFSISPQRECSWLHATFHEYFTAEFISEDADDPWKFIDRWRDDHWRSVTVFLFDNWSGKRDVSREILRILGDGRLDALILSAEIIAEGAAVTDEVAQEMASKLCTTLIEDLGTQSDAVNGRHGLTQLVLSTQGIIRLLANVRRLHSIGPSLNALADQLAVMSKHEDQSGVAIAALEQLGCVQQLGRIVSDPESKSFAQFLAFPALVRLGEWETAKPFLNTCLLNLSKQDAQSILEIIRHSAKLDGLRESVRASNLDVGVRSYAMKLLALETTEDEIKGMAGDPNLPQEIRLVAELIFRKRFVGGYEFADSLAILGLSREPFDMPRLEKLVFELRDIEEWDELARIALTPEMPTSVQSWIIVLLGVSRRTQEIKKLVEVRDVEVRLEAVVRLNDLEPSDQTREILLGAYSAYLNEQPDDLAATRKMADVLRAMNRNEEAVKVYTRILMVKTDNIALCHRAVAYRKLRKYQEALSDLKQAIKDDPDDWTHIQRGHVYRLLGQHENAISDFLRAVELRSSATSFFEDLGDSYRRTLDFTNAITWLNKAVDVSPDARNLTYRAQTNLDLARTQECLGDVNQAIELDQGFGLSREVRGECYRQLGQYDDALSDFMQALKLGRTQVLSQMISICLMLGRYQQAQEHLDVARAGDTKEAWYLYLQALVFSKLKSHIEVSSLLNAAIAESKDALRSRTDTYRLESNTAIYSLALGDFSAAKEIYTRLLLDRQGRFRIRRFAVREISELAALRPDVPGVLSTLHWLQSVDLSADAVCPNPQVLRSTESWKPVYCSLSRIEGLDAEYEVCQKILEVHSKLGKVIVLLKLPEPDWVYGQCNFKMEINAHHNLKFMDRLNTIVNRDLRMFSDGLGHFTLVLKQPEFFQQFKRLGVESRFGMTLLLHLAT